MNRRIVIPVNGGKLSQHFGHCEAFCFIDIENGKITKKEEIVPPAHEPGLYPKWTKAQGATDIVCGGMGIKARNMFTDEGVQVHTGALSDDPVLLAEALDNGTLQTGANTCDH